MFRPMRSTPVSPFAAPESLADYAAIDNGQRALSHLDNMADNRRRAGIAAFVASGKAITPIDCTKCEEGWKCVCCCSLEDWFDVWSAPSSPSGLVCCSVCGYPSLASVRGACECPDGADWVACPADAQADL